MIKKNLIFLSLFAVFISMFVFVISKANTLTVVADHCDPSDCPDGAHADFKCDTGEWTGCPPCDNCGGGAIQPDVDARFNDIPN